jgi:hypothetical protein
MRRQSKAIPEIKAENRNQIHILIDKWDLKTLSCKCTAILGSIFRIFFRGKFRGKFFSVKVRENDNFPRKFYPPKRGFCAKKVLKNRFCLKFGGKFRGKKMFCNIDPSNFRVNIPDFLHEDFISAVCAE